MLVLVESKDSQELKMTKGQEEKSHLSGNHAKEKGLLREQTFKS